MFSEYLLSDWGEGRGGGGSGGGSGDGGCGFFIVLFFILALISGFGGC